MDPYSPTGRPQWSWPADVDSQQGGEAVGASTSANTRHDGAPGAEPKLPRQRQTTDQTDQTDHPGQTGQTGQPDQTGQGERHYKSRTCRICLDVVQPSTEILDSGAGIFAPKVRVKYVSEDPELGRLLCPCKCKGSQKYVHEGCLQAWRQAAPLSDRNFWRCPTCQFEYRMERLRWGHWLSSRWARGALTLLVMLFAVFLLGFVADPIINLWLDPFGSIADTISEVIADVDGLREEEVVDLDEQATWSYHFLKGLFSLGLLGFVKSFLAMTPWQWFNLRHGGVLGGGRGRRGGGRDRLESISWALIIIGVITFLGVSNYALHLPFCVNSVLTACSGDLEIG